MLGAVVVMQGATSAEPEGLQRALKALRAQCNRVLIIGGAEDDARASGAEHRPLPREASELAALTIALREAGGTHVVVLTADLCRPSSELVRYMQHVRGSFEAIVPEGRDGRLQPLAALYHASLLRRAEGLLAAGERDLVPLLELASVRHVTAEEVAKFGEPENLLARAGQSFM